MISLFMNVIFILLIGTLTGNDIEEKLNSVLKDVYKCKSNQIVGLSVSVTRSNISLFQHGYGVKNLNLDGENVTADSLFSIASCTKAFASTLLVKLLEEKTKFNIDTKLSTFFKNDKIFEDSLRSKYATIKDLLAHRMGIPSHNKIRLDPTLTRENLIHRLKYLKATGKFRDSFYYSNLMYGLITYMAEVVGGDKWENLVQEHIFKPLGMTSSSFASKTTIDTFGYNNFFGELIKSPMSLEKQWAELCGSGCIQTNARDIQKWLRLFLNEGKLQNGTRLISKQAYEAITSPVTALQPATMFTKPTVPVTNSQTGYALGWKTGHYRGNNMLIHSGSTYGYRALISIYPDNDLAIFTAMSGGDPSFLLRTSLHAYIFDLFNNEEPWLNSTTLCSFPEPWKTKAASWPKPTVNKTVQPKRPLVEYVGTYTNPAYGQITIIPHEQKLNGLTLTYGIITFDLFPKNEKDEFIGDALGYFHEIVMFPQNFKINFQDDIVHLEVPFFEPKDPPIFTRFVHSSCSSKLLWNSFVFVLIGILYCY